MVLQAVFLILTAICFFAEGCVLLGIWLFRREETGTTGASASSPSGEQGWWCVQLVDVMTGKRVGKVFRTRLTLGRTTSAMEPMNILFVGNNRTISRSQCEIFPGGDGLVVRNLSGVNMTWHNGSPLREGHPLRQGDCLDMGGNRYVLERVDRVA